jgi:chaperonin GroEL (HSP60 family)
MFTKPSDGTTTATVLAQAIFRNPRPVLRLDASRLG